MRENTINNITKNLDEFELAYIQEILNISPLANEETLKLIKRIQNGDLEASKKLIYHNLKLILSNAQCYTLENVDIFDLLHEGSLIIIDAAKKYDFNNNTDANKWILIQIRYKILNFIAEYTQIIPRGIYYFYLKYEKTFNELKDILNREPTDEEISRVMKTSLGNLRKCKKYFNRIDNLIPLFKCKNIENLVCDSINDINESMEKSSMLTDFKNIYKEAKLNDFQIKVLKSYYGLDGNDKLTLDQIADKFNFTRQYIQQVKDRAFIKIVTCDYMKEMANYMPYPKKSLDKLDELKTKLKAKKEKQKVKK